MTSEADITQCAKLLIGGGVIAAGADAFCMGETGQLQRPTVIRYARSGDTLRS